MRIHFPSFSAWDFGIQKKRIFLLITGVILSGVLFFLLWGSLGGPTENTIRTFWLIDASLSMGAEERIGTGTTTRIEIVKDSVSRIIESGASGENAVSLFALDTRMVVPFSSSNSAVSQFVQSIPLIRYGGGSDIISALDTAIDAFSDTSVPTRIVLITDGGDCDNCSTFTRKITNPRLFVTIVGVGNTVGTPIPLGRDTWGATTYKMYDRAQVLSARNDVFLRALAKSIGVGLFLIDPEDSDSWGRIFSRENYWYALSLLFLTSIVSLATVFFPRFSRISHP